MGIPALELMFSRTQCFPWLDSGVYLHEAVVWTDPGAGHTEPALIRQIKCRNGLSTAAPVSLICGVHRAGRPSPSLSDALGA